MRRLVRLYLVALVIALLASAAASESVHRFGGSFDMGFPQEEFRDNVDNTGYGGGLFLAIGLPDVPMSVGASLDFLEYGRESREAPWSTTIPDVFLDVTTSNDLLAGHLFIRLQPTRGFFQPYVEGLIGFHYLWTSTSVHDQGDDSEEIASTKHLSDLAFSYGAGAGIMFRVWKPSGGLKPPANTAGGDQPELRVPGDTGSAGAGEESKAELGSIGIFLDVRYLRGGEADYLREGSIQIEGGRVRYDVRHSRTDIVMVRIGVSFNLL